MRKHAGITMMICGAVMICAAVGMIAANQHQEVQSEKNARLAGQVVEEQISYNAEQETPIYVPGPEQEKELSVEILDGYPYIGTLYLPTLELKVPVMESWTEERLQVAPCRQFGTTNHDMVIAGHNYRAHFGKLKNLVLGDPVTFTDMDGKQTVYEVNVMEVIQPTQLDRVMDPELDLVLYTCTYGGRTRLMVGCCIVDPEDFMEQ